MSRSWLLRAGALVSAITLAASAQEPEPSGNPDEEALEETGGSGENGPGAVAPAEPRPRVEEPDEPGPEPPIVAPAPDTLSGHFSLAPSFALAIPFGYSEADTLQSQVMSTGYGFGLDLGYGLSRSVAAGAWGEFQRLGSGDACPSCKTRSTAVGAFVRYHLVQGMRFDPWMGAGLGYRSTTTDTPTGSVTYSGIEILRLQLGGDWYAFDKVGFGPFLELAMGRYGSRSPGRVGDGANHWLFMMGARITLDVPGK
jgi:hypothetical protein